MAWDHPIVTIAREALAKFRAPVRDGTKRADLLMAQSTSKVVHRSSRWGLKPPETGYKNLSLFFSLVMLMKMSSKARCYLMRVFWL